MLNVSWSEFCDAEHQKETEIGQGSIFFFFPKIMSLYFSSPERNQTAETEMTASKLHYVVIAKQLIYLTVRKYIL